MKIIFRIKSPKYSDKQRTVSRQRESYFRTTIHVIVGHRRPLVSHWVVQRHLFAYGTERCLDGALLVLLVAEEIEVAILQLTMGIGDILRQFHIASDVVNVSS